MGSPTYLDRRQIRALMKASELHREKIEWYADESGVSLNLSIQPHSVVVVTLDCETKRGDLRT